MNRRTFRQRLLYHHLPLAVASAACCLLVFALAKTQYLPFGLSMATAYTGALLLGVTLVLGVLKVLRGETSPVSTDWRRDVGIWAALFGLAHVVIGLQVHAPGRMRTYFVYPAEESHSFPLRFDAFGWANHLGLVAGLLLVLLLVLSNDWSLTRLGARRWKGLQRWNYTVFGLVLAHGVLYQVLEKRIACWVITFAVLSVVVIALQVVGFRRRRDQKRASQPAPAIF
jgi:methionine sulfoxide reductase heme-binding subunit